MIEEMKTAIDFVAKKDKENKDRIINATHAAKRQNKRYDAGSAKSTGSLSDLSTQMQLNNDSTMHGLKAAMHGFGGEHKEYLKHQKASADAADKASDYDRKNDAIDRHNRRHPDRAVGESVSDIVELLQ